MELKDLAATLRRRWYLVLVSLLCSAAATYFVVAAVGPTYEAKATVLMMPPSTSTSTQQAGNVGNPLLQLGSLGQARDVLIRVLTSQATSEVLCQPQRDPVYEAMRAELCGSRPGVSFEATPDFTSSAPMVQITVEGNTPANSVVALRAVTDQIPVILTDIQSGLNLRPRSEITSIPVVVDSLPEIVHKKQIRAGIVAGAGVLGLSLLLVALVDGLLASRRPKARPGVDDVDDYEQAAGVSPEDVPVWDLGADAELDNQVEVPEPEPEGVEIRVSQPQGSGRR